MSLTVSDQRPARKLGPTSADVGSTARLSRGRGRSVPALYGGLSLVLVAGALTFALSSPPPSTPPLAAVAPAPQEQVDVERVEQSSRFGEGGDAGEGECVAGDDGCAGVGETAATAPDAAPQTVVETGTPSGFHRCAPGPGGHRQTEDPQSPPCVATRFPVDGDNGGATATGVTRDAVRVVVPAIHPNGSAAWEDEPYLRAFETHFNDRYELHGRRLVLDFVDGDRSVRDPEGARAFAYQVAAREPFASLDPPTHAPTYFEALADEAIVSTSGAQSFPMIGLEDPSRLGPYLWSVFPDVPSSLVALGDLACGTLVGRPAQHAAADLADDERRLGLLVETYRGVRVDPAPLTGRLDACAAPHATYDAGDGEPATLDGAFHRMRADGVTTVVCVCRNLDTEYTKSAERVGFGPEWLLPYDEHVTDGETSYHTTDHPKTQLGRAFGLSPKLRRPGRTAGYAAQNHAEQYWFTALREADPDLTVPESGADRLYGYYAQLLVLASGIQHAGPELTPDTFAAALHGLRYPNPGVGSAPWFQPGVGFGPGDHVFNSDWSLFWFESTVDGPSSGSSFSNQANKGRLCYLEDGVRFTPGGWPAAADDMFFDPEAGCR